MNNYIHINTQADLDNFIKINYTQEQINAINEYSGNVNSPLFEYKGGYYRHFNQLLRANAEHLQTDYDITGLNTFISSFSINTDLIT